MHMTLASTICRNNTRLEKNWWVNDGCSRKCDLLEVDHCLLDCTATVTLRNTLELSKYRLLYYVCALWASCLRTPRHIIRSCNLHELEHGQKDWRGLHSTPFSVLPSFFTPLHSPLLNPPAVWDLCKLPDPVRSRPKYSYDYQLIAVAVSICYLLWPPCVADADIVFSSCSLFFFLSIFFLSSLKLAARCPVNGCWPSCWYWDEPSDPVYTIQPVVTPVKHPVEQPAASCK